MKKNWISLNVSSSELCIRRTLNCGQSFRWKGSGTDEWTCVLDKKLISLKQTENDTLFHTPHSTDEFLVQTHLRDYFRLNLQLKDLYQQWNTDPNFRLKAGHFSGIRILRQDPLENLISFICSSNNNIIRISSMIDNLCKKYGEFVGTLNDIDYHAFPTVSALLHDSLEVELRQLGFGYRAKYIKEAVHFIHQEKGGVEWLMGLRSLNYPECKLELMNISGVGPKVSDCVCLMSLDKLDAVPVDTHMIQIAQRDYKLKLPTKSLTEKSYNAIGNHFRKIFGLYAGWAHSVLFAADLRSLEDDYQPTKKRKKGSFETKEDLNATLGVLIDDQIATDLKLEDNAIIKKEI